MIEMKVGVKKNTKIFIKEEHRCINEVLIPAPAFERNTSGGLVFHVRAHPPTLTLKENPNLKCFKYG